MLHCILSLHNRGVKILFRTHERIVVTAQTNQSHLQNLLDAKAKELVQAERLIAQYRYRNVQSDTEVRGLTNLPIYLLLFFNWQLFFNISS